MTQGERPHFSSLPELSNSTAVHAVEAEMTLIRGEIVELQDQIRGLCETEQRLKKVLAKIVNPSGTR
jgi:hypothetical protein